MASVPRAARPQHSSPRSAAPGAPYLSSLGGLDHESKIKSAKKHFAAIGIDDYAKSSPENWNL